MKKIAIIISGITLFGLIGINQAFGADNCEAFSAYKKYECQQIKYCSKYKPESIVFQGELYPDMQERKTLQDDGASDLLKSTNPLEVGGKIYRENQNNIYACSIIQIQENSYKLIKTKLLKIDKSGTLNGELQKKINLKLRKLSLLAKNKGCNITDSQTIYKKKQTLIESTYELCKYMFYMEYTKEYYENIENVVGPEIVDDDVEDYSIAISILEKKLSDKKALIQDEINHSYKIFELAFHSYLDYENNVGIHILLELLREDFIVYRQKLYQTLSPINQVVYKIRNAMSY